MELWQITSLTHACTGAARLCERLRAADLETGADGGSQD